MRMRKPVVGEWVRLGLEYIMLYPQYPECGPSQGTMQRPARQCSALAAAAKAHFYTPTLPMEVKGNLKGGKG